MDVEHTAFASTVLRSDCFVPQVPRTTKGVSRLCAMMGSSKALAPCCLLCMGTAGLLTE